MCLQTFSNNANNYWSSSKRFAVVFQTHITGHVPGQNREQEQLFSAHLLFFPRDSHSGFSHAHPIHHNPNSPYLCPIHLPVYFIFDHATKWSSEYIIFMSSTHTSQCEMHWPTPPEKWSGILLACKIFHASAHVHDFALKPQSERLRFGVRTLREM